MKERLNFILELSHLYTYTGVSLLITSHYFQKGLLRQSLWMPARDTGTGRDNEETQDEQNALLTIDICYG
jgi:hypothetical protein